MTVEIEQILDSALFILAISVLLFAAVCKGRVRGGKLKS